MACALLKLPDYPSTLLPKYPGCHPFQRKHQTRQLIRLHYGSFPAASATVLRLRLACLQLAPQLPGIVGDHRVQVTSARLPPGLEHRPPPARADAERELRERSPQPDQLRPHPRRSRLPPVQQRPAVQRQAPVIPMRLYGAASVLAASWWRVVFTGGHGSARLPDVPGALAFHAGTPHAFGLAAAQRPDRPGPPRAVELPSVAAAGQADIVPVISTAHAATIHDISLRTHYTRGSHGEMARKLLIAPSHTGAGARQDRRNAMRPSAFDPPAIPAAFWERPDVCQALRQRDMSALFRLLQQYLGLSQTRIGTAVGLGQGRMSEVINGIRKIRDAKVFERIADGLDMPDHARVLLGLSPRQITAARRRAAGTVPVPGRTPTCSGRSPRPGASTAPSSASCRARPTTSGSWTAASAPPPSRASWKPTSATSRPACGTPCAPGTASSSPGPWPTPQR